MRRATNGTTRSIIDCDFSDYFLLYQRAIFYFIDTALTHYFPELTLFSPDVM